MARMMKSFRKTAANLMVVLALSASCVTAALAGDRAVIVGVNTYPALNNGDLRQARSDALKFRDFLISEMKLDASEITLLLDRDATRPSVLRAVKSQLIDGTSAGDRAIFYFSGHGHRVRDDTFDELRDKKDEILVLSDIGTDTGGFIIDDELGALFQAIPDRRVLVVVDSCHSGTITRTVGSDAGTDVAMRTFPAHQLGALDVSLYPPLIDLPALGSSRSLTDGTFVPGQSHMNVWSAATEDQVALENSRGGVFTRAFIAGMRNNRADSNQNGLVSNSELLRFVRSESDAFCRKSKLCKEMNRGQLTPEFSGAIENPAAFLQASESQVAVQDQIASQTSSGEQAPSQQSESSVAVQDPPLPFSSQAGFAPLNQPGVLTDLFVPQNDAGLQVSINPGDKLRLGQTVSFDVRAERSGYLLLFDYNPEGELFQIFPSRLSQEAAERLNPGEHKRIPEALSRNNRPIQIKVSKPTGRGHLVGVLVEDEVQDVLAVLPDNVNLEPVPNAQAYLFSLAERLNRATTNDGVTRPIRWSSVIVPYEIVQ